MTEGLEAITVASMSKALDAASLRQQAIASNIANVNTVGYVRQEVSFESQLDDVRQEIAERGSTDLFTLASVNARVAAATARGGANAKVELDMEMADMASNAMQYQTLLKALAKNYSLLSSAANDGRK
jgi:flagellar basal-body rod protein FlgB